MGVSESQLRFVHWGAIIHDVGKIGVSDAILRKPGALTDAKWAEMRRHPEIGYAMLKDIAFLRPALDIVRYHHERYDGAGYPVGLAGEEIPLAARIFAAVDAYDAMTSDRPYRRARSREEALAEIQRLAGAEFDPRVVQVLLRALRDSGRDDRG
jgi:HD-GYP domain-containing protein (c-di-GMP phosphodiesterase class II)